MQIKKVIRNLAAVSLMKSHGVHTAHCTAEKEVHTTNYQHGYLGPVWSQRAENHNLAGWTDFIYECEIMTAGARGKTDRSSVQDS